MHELPLASSQRCRLLDFVEMANRVFGDGGFNRAEEIDDIHLTILAPMAAQLCGVQDSEIGQFFSEQFALHDIDEAALSRLLSIVMPTSVEDRIKAAGGGRN